MPGIELRPADAAVKGFLRRHETSRSFFLQHRDAPMTLNGLILEGVDGHGLWVAFFFFFLQTLEQRCI